MQSISWIIPNLEIEVFLSAAGRDSIGSEAGVLWNCPESIRTGIGPVQLRISGLCAHGNVRQGRARQLERSANSCACIICSSRSIASSGKTISA